MHAVLPAACLPCLALLVGPLVAAPPVFNHRTLTHPTREGMALADLDLDGDLDVVLNGFWFETPADALRDDFTRHDIDAKWFTQTGGGWPDNASYVRVADLNRDGLPDVVICHSEKVGYPLSWYAVDSLAQVKTGPWREHVIANTFDWAETLDVGDLDHDGAPDVFCAKFQRHDPPGGRWYNEPPFPVSIFYNVAGDGSRWRRHDLALDGTYAAVLGDVGSDGDLDVVGPRSYWTGPIRLWENQDSNRPLALDRWHYLQIDADRAKCGDFPAAGVKKNIRYFGLALADLTGDGQPDIAVTEERYPGKEPDANLWWFEAPANPATGEWQRHRVVTTWSLNNLDAADFDHDGDIDLVTCEHKGTELRLLLYANDGRGRFTEHVLDRGKESHLGTFAADLDGDGDLDLASIGWDQHKFLHVWRNDAIPSRPAGR